MVPKWCPDVKNKVVKRKTATITRYKKSLCLQGFSQITYKKICGNTGRFWLFHDPRNQVYRQRYRGFESHPLRQTTSIPIRGWMLFFVVGEIRKPAPWRHAGGMSQPAWENPTHSAGWLRHPGMDVVFLLWVGFESRRLGDMPAACRNRRGRDEKFMPRRGKACPRCVQPRTQKARNQMPF